MENINLKVVETHPNYLIVQAGWEKYYLSSHYYINNIQFTINAQLDDILILKGKTEDLQSINNFYEFDFKLFLNANNVNKKIVVKSGKVKIITGKTLRNIFFNYVNTFPTIIKNWTKLLLFAQQTQENKDIFTTFTNFGITPILVISGLHINFFFMFFKKSLFFIKHELIKLLICFVILFFLLIFT